MEKKDEMILRVILVKGTEFTRLQFLWLGCLCLWALPPVSQKQVNLIGAECDGVQLE